MNESIWLRQVIILMLNSESSPLGVSYRYLKDLLHVKAAAIYLREISEEREPKLIYIEKDAACMYPVPEKDREQLASIIRQVLETKDRAPMERGYAVPLRCAAADVFGALIVETDDRAWDPGKQEAVASISELIYGNAMGGFMKSPRPSVLEVKDISAKYDIRDPGAPNIVEGASFTINAGEITVLMGYSGCGKSTLLNVIGGLLTPVSGEVLWDGKDICRMNRRELDAYHRDTLGFIFQNYNLISDLTALENVSVAAALCADPRDPEELLKTLGLGHRVHARPKQMSGGEQQRVCIARALVKNPKILLCDEPTGALDTENTRNIMRLLQQIAKEQNIPVVIVTHNPDFVVLADHYIFMKDGGIAEDYYQPFPFSAAEVL